MESILTFVFVLGLIVLVHELGHLVSAKAFGVYCKEFAIGMGPKLLKWQGKETLYSIRALPFGGFVSMLGEEGVVAEGIELNRSIVKITPLKRIVVMLSGIFMNFVLALIIMFSLNLQAGSIALTPEPILGAVMENMPAQTAGMQEGDRILKLTFSDNTTQVPEDFYDVIEALQFYHDEITFTLDRNGQSIDITITPTYNQDTQTYMIGVQTPEYTIKEIGVIDSLKYAFIDIKDMVSSIFTTLTRLIRGVGLNAVSGPVGIFQVTAESAQYGMRAIMYLVALLSVNIAVFNLIPLPILDGGRSLLIFVEMLRKKPLNEKFEQGIMIASMVLMLLLFIIISIKDVFTFF